MQTRCKIRKMGNCLQIFLSYIFALFGKWYGQYLADWVQQPILNLQIQSFVDFLNNWNDFYNLRVFFVYFLIVSFFDKCFVFSRSELVVGSGGQQRKIRKMGNCLQIFLWSTFALFGKWIFFWSMHISVIILCQHDSIMSVQIKILFSTLFLYSMLQNFHVKISIIQK